MIRNLRHSSFRRYPLGGAVFRGVCASARLIHCRADSGKPGLGIQVQASSSAVPADRDLAVKWFNTTNRFCLDLLLSEETVYILFRFTSITTCGVVLRCMTRTSQCSRLVYVTRSLYTCSCNLFSSNYINCHSFIF